MSDLALRRKLTVTAHGRRVVLVKRAGESAEHVVGKALLWALYLPAYPAVTVEVPAGDRFKPDVVAFGPDGRPRFWGESGKVSAEKVRALGRRYPDAHLAHVTWRVAPAAGEAFVRAALAGVKRRAPFDLLFFAPADAARLVGDDGAVTATFADLAHVRIGP